MTLVLITCMIGLCLVTVRGAKAQPAPVLTGIQEVRAETKKTRARKCLDPIRYQWPAVRVPVELRAYTFGVNRWQLIRSMFAGRHRCLPSSPEGIIRYVFPASTEDAAVRVADCESGLYPYAKNPSSSASGLFQLLSFHWAGKFNPFDPWANTRYAYRLSRAGTNWGPWVCKP